MASPDLAEGDDSQDQDSQAGAPNSNSDHLNHKQALELDLPGNYSHALSPNHSVKLLAPKIEASPSSLASFYEQIVTTEPGSEAAKNIDSPMNDTFLAYDLDTYAEEAAVLNALKSSDTSEVGPPSLQNRMLPMQPESSNTTYEQVAETAEAEGHLERARHSFQQSLVVIPAGASALQPTKVDDDVILTGSRNKTSPILIDSEAEDRAAAARFRAAKKAFRRKEKRGEARFEDEINFRRSQASELQRQKLTARKRAAEDHGQAEQEDEDNNTGDSDQPRQHDGLFCSENESNSSVVKSGERSKPSKMADGPPNKKPRKARPNRIPEKALIASMEAGRQPWKEAAEKRASKKQRNKGPPKRRGPAAGGLKPRGDKSENLGANSKGRRPPIRKGPRMANVESLLRNDIIGDAQAIQGREGQATFAAKNRKGALAELIASVPEDQRKPHVQTKHALDEACRNFTWKGKGTMKPDEGKWRLKGMKTSLMPHQLLGASWMRERENSSTRPWGGIVADSMGFGKTIMCLANILDGQPSERSPNRTTLIVCPSSLCSQWLTQIQTHVQEGLLGSVILYRSGTRIVTDNIVGALSSCGVVITTYHEVLRSYPNIEEPLHLVSPEAKDEFWKEQFESKKGYLHRIFFRRIILDEATLIKNWRSKISIACNGLVGKYKWALSGTPIHNRVEELYPYFKFTQIPHTGSFETFRQNFCTRTPASMGRLHTFLRIAMLRRTLADEMFGRPIVKLPPIDRQIILVDFDPTERAIYRIVKSRFVSKINEWSKGGTIDKQFRGVWNLYLRLRQLCGHVLLIRKVMMDLLLAEDFEKLVRLTEREVSLSKNRDGLRTIGGLKQILENSPTSCSGGQSSSVALDGDQINEDAAQNGGGAVVNAQRFRRFLRMSKESGKWDEILARSFCHKCHQVPEEPHITVPCEHIYCKECLDAMLFAIRHTERQKALCLACQSEFERSEPCLVHEQASSNVEEPSSDRSRGKGSGGSSKLESKEVDWLELDGTVLLSAKTAAAKAQLRTWLSEDENTKVVIFTQFLDLMRILARSFSGEGWAWCEFKGSMSPEQRDRSIQDFTNKPDIRVMLASLKCGGLGLNLTMANKVILLDPWWNEAAEDQAWSRVYRIGQEKDVEIRRFCVRDTIDTDMLLTMQARKNKEIDWAIGPDSQPEKATLASLMSLFGPITIDQETGRPVINEDGDSGFIYIDDEQVENGDSDAEPPAEPPPRPF